MIPRLMPSSLQSDLVEDWFPGNITVQRVFFSSDVRSFLNIFNRSLPGEHVRVMSAEIISAQVIIGNNLIFEKSFFISLFQGWISSSCATEE